MGQGHSCEWEAVGSQRLLAAQCLLRGESEFEQKAVSWVPVSLNETLDLVLGITVYGLKLTKAFAGTLNSLDICFWLVKKNLAFKLVVQ